MHLKNIPVSAEGQNTDTRLQDEWFQLLPRCLFLPTCIRLSWWKKLAKRSATQTQIQIDVRWRVDTAAAPRHTSVCTQVEEVTMRFVIHFVSVYSIIHPGGQRASNMPGTACDRVQQLWSKIFMRHFCVRKKKMQVPGYLCSWLALTGWRCALKSVRSANRLTVDENGRTDWLESHTLFCFCTCV